MAMTLTYIGKAPVAVGCEFIIYNLTASSSGDTSTVSVAGGQPYKTDFMDANSNQIVTNPPTFGAWTTSNGITSATLTANAGGVVTNGKMLLTVGGN